MLKFSKPGAKLPVRMAIQFLCLAALLLPSAASVAQYTSIAPNWNLPQWYDTSQSPYQNGVFSPAPTAGQIPFAFTFAQDENVTSAAVINSAGKMVRTLWMNRAYHAGTWGEIWDGTDDYGTLQPAGSYQIKIAANNVQYTWDGIVGNTESDWNGPNNWDNLGTFPTGIAFLNGTGCEAGNYSEQTYSIYCFPEATPNSSLTPQNRLFVNMDAFDIVTDGKLYYVAIEDPISGGYGMIAAFQTNGNVYNFPIGTQVGPGASVDTGAFTNGDVYPSTNLGKVTIVDLSAYPTTAITGVAVELNGNVLATAHGEVLSVASANKIYLWNKTTGAALGSISVPNPQKIVFDNNNNLWVVSGYGVGDVLYEVTGIGPSTASQPFNVANVSNKTPISGLSNPISLSVSILTGDVFVADGGTNQQVFEYNTSTYALVSTLGTKGGYGTGTSCNPAVTNTKFWFDPGPNLAIAHAVGQKGPWGSAISVDETGGLWVIDQTSERLLHFTYQSGVWTYVNRVALAWSNVSAITDGAPTRLFGGFLGLEEYSRNYSIPLQPGDAEAPGGNGAWALVRNWLPCVTAANTDWATVAQFMNYGYTLPNGKVIYQVENTPTVQYDFYMLNTDGTISYTPTPTYWSHFLDPVTGALWVQDVTGTSPSYQTSIQEAPITGYTSTGFPIWGSYTTVATYASQHNLGNPVATTGNGTAATPSSGGIFPVFDAEVNQSITGSTPAFHLGGVPLNGTALQWQTMPQENILYPDDDGSYPAIVATANGGGDFAGGTTVTTRAHNLFPFFNGNWHTFGCQYFHFLDDGMFIGQFGFKDNPDEPVTGINGAGIGLGYPPRESTTPLAPGFCGDEVSPHYIQDPNQPADTAYYVFNGDEAYRKGVHEWHITNLQSIQEIVQTLPTVSSSSTSVVVSANPSQVLVGQGITLTASVSSVVNNTRTPTGTITFYNGSTALTSATIGTGGNATVTISTLAAGSYAITATYFGDNTYTGSSSYAGAIVIVDPAPPTATTISLGSLPLTAYYGQTILVPATVSAVGTSKIPGGTVTFTSGTTDLGTEPVNVSGVANLATSSLPYGVDQVTATYNGTQAFSSSTATATTSITVTTQNVWVVNSNQTLSELDNTATAISPGSGYVGGGDGIAIDGFGNVYSATSSADTVTRFNRLGAPTGTLSGGGLNAPVALAVSGTGYIWVANTNNSLTAFNAGGTVVTPSTGFTGGNLSTPAGIAIDSAGNVWVANTGNDSVTKFVGAADPVVTPLAKAAQTNTQGARP